MIYTHAMLDIETLSTRSDAAIVDIGVVLFDIAAGRTAQLHQGVGTNKPLMLEG